MHNILYLPLTEADILDAVDYIADRLGAPTTAAELLAELDETVLRLARFPYAHQLYRTDRPMRDEVRQVAVKNYVLYYSVTPDTVEVRRLLHGRRNRTNLFD